MISSDNKIRLLIIILGSLILLSNGIDFFLKKNFKINHHKSESSINKTTRIEDTIVEKTFKLNKTNYVFLKPQNNSNILYKLKCNHSLFIFIQSSKTPFAKINFSEEDHVYEKIYYTYENIIINTYPEAFHIKKRIIHEDLIDLLFEENNFQS